VDSGDHAIAPFQAAVFAALFFFGFGNGAAAVFAVGVAASLIAAQRLICA